MVSPEKAPGLRLIAGVAASSDWISTPFGKYWSLVANGDQILAQLRLIEVTVTG